MNFKLNFMKKLIYIGAFSSLIFSCSVSKKITKYRDSKDPILNQNVNGMLSRPLLADLSVDNVRKEVTYNALLKISEDEADSLAKLQYDKLALPYRNHIYLFLD